jgi:hypothetical protein
MRDGVSALRNERVQHPLPPRLSRLHQSQQGLRDGLRRRRTLMALTHEASSMPVALFNSLAQVKTLGVRRRSSAPHNQAVDIWHGVSCPCMPIKSLSIIGLKNNREHLRAFIRKHESPDDCLAHASLL